MTHLYIEFNLTNREIGKRSKKGSTSKKGNVLFIKFKYTNVPIDTDFA